MKRFSTILIAVLMLGAFLLTACGGQSGDGADTRPAPPADFAGKTNPHTGDAAVAASGETLFAANCASCHGESGLGDGPAGAALNPKPSNLQTAAKAAGDDYFFWRISEGGAMEPFNSSMPAWKGVLSEDEIWQVVTFINTWE